eukprot:766773-Hanusia_phi.AAC.2
MAEEMVVEIPAPMLQLLAPCSYSYSHAPTCSFHAPTPSSHHPTPAPTRKWFSDLSAKEAHDIISWRAASGMRDSTQIFADVWVLDFGDCD